MTDQERLDRALAQAAEQVEVLSHQPHLTKLHAYLAGWAEAVEALIAHDCTYRTEERDKAIASFCDAMLGGSDE